MVIDASTGRTVDLNLLPPDNLLIGELKWVGESRDCNVTIAVLVDDEQRNEEGKIPLRGVVLARTASEVYREHYGENFFKGDKLAIQVRTDDLAKDLDNGLGLRGKKYLIGENFFYLKR
jgi:hypothetical protein